MLDSSHLRNARSSKAAVSLEGGRPALARAAALAQFGAWELPTISNRRRSFLRPRKHGQ